MGIDTGSKKKKIRNPSRYGVNLKGGGSISSTHARWSGIRACLCTSTYLFYFLSLVFFSPLSLCMSERDGVCFSFFFLLKFATELLAIRRLHPQPATSMG